MSIATPNTVSYEADVRAAAAAWEALCPVDRATTYYFDSVAGEDSNDGLSESTPKQSFTALKAIFDAAISGSTDNATAVKIKCGSQYNTQTTLNIGGGSLSSYGTGAKPRFLGWSDTYNGSWTPDTGDAYTISVASEPTWLWLETLDIGQPLEKVAFGLADSTDYSWAWDDGTLYVNLAGDSPNGLTFWWEDSANTAANIDGILAGDGSRVDGIECIGHAFRSNNAQTYGISTPITGGETAVVTNCECWYHWLHNLGQNEVTANGGNTLYKGCRWGWLGSPAATGHVAYAGSGGQTAIVLDCEARYGLVPGLVSAASNRSHAVFGHTDGGANYVAGFHVVNLECGDDPNGNTLIGACTDVPAVSDIAAARVVFHRCRMGEYLRAAENFAQRSSVHSSCILRLKPAYVATQALTTQPSDGWVVGCFVTVDMTDWSDQAQQHGVWNNEGNVAPQIANSWLHLIHSGNASRRCAWNYEQQFTFKTADRGARVYNSILTGDDNGEALYLGLDNTSEHSGNAIFGYDNTTSTTFAGSAGNWTGTINLASQPDLAAPVPLPELQSRGDATAPLKSATDYYGNPLPNPGDSIGPFARPQRQRRPIRHSIRSAIREVF